MNIMKPIRYPLITLTHKDGRQLVLDINDDGKFETKGNVELSEGAKIFFDAFSEMIDYRLKEIAKEMQNKN